MKKRFIAIPLLLLGGAGGSYAVYKQTQSKAEKPLGRTVKVSQGNLRIVVTETGTLEPVTKVDVKSRVAGRLNRIYIRAGDRVKVGQVLAMVDPTEVKRVVAGVEAQLDAARAGLAQSGENYKLAVTQNQFAVQRAEVNLEDARAKLKDAEIGLKDTQVTVLDAQAGIADAQVGAKTARVSLDRTAAPTRSQEIDQADLAVSRAQAQQANTKRDLERQQQLLERGFVSQQAIDNLKTNLSLADKEVETAQKRLDLLKEGPRKEDVDVSRMGIEQASIRIRQANIRLEQARVRQDQAKSRVNQAHIAVKNAEVQLATEKANVAQAALKGRDVQRSQADVHQVENQLAQQSVSLTETQIIAPIAGEVTGKYLEEGELVASATAGFAQGAAIATIADLSHMQVKVNINEVDVAKLRRDLLVEVKVDGIPDASFIGKVYAIAPASLSASSTTSQASQGSVVRFEVKIGIEKPDKRLRPGMTATVNIITTEHPNVILLPTEALSKDNKVTLISGEKGKETRKEQAVTIGLRNASQLEILSGLKVGDVVEVAPVDAKDRRKIAFDGPN